MTALKRLAFPLQSPEFCHHVETDHGRAIQVLGKDRGCIGMHAMLIFLSRLS
jgi:hypothetical protein